MTADVISPYAPLTTEQRVRLRCLKLALALDLPGCPLREVAGGLADFILHGVKTAPDDVQSMEAIGTEPDPDRCNAPVVVQARGGPSNSRQLRHGARGMGDEELRLACLKLACADATEPTNAVIERAQAYMAFVLATEARRDA